MRYTLPIRLVSVANLREHWRVKAERTAEHRLLAKMTVKRHPLPVRVLLTRVGPVELDDDNLRGAFKAIRDGIADALGVDDKDKRIVWEYAQQPGRRKSKLRPAEYAAIIDIEPLVESRGTS